MKIPLLLSNSTLISYIENHSLLNFKTNIKGLFKILDLYLF